MRRSLLVPFLCLVGCTGIGLGGAADDPDAAVPDSATSEDSTVPRCGDGIIDPTEDCDGPNLGGLDCVSLGYDSGSLSCSGCAYDMASCVASGPVCGNGIVESGEQCDDGNHCITDSCPDGVDGTCRYASCGDGFCNHDGEGPAQASWCLDDCGCDARVDQITGCGSPYQNGCFLVIDEATGQHRTECGPNSTGSTLPCSHNTCPASAACNIGYSNPPYCSYLCDLDLPQQEQGCNPNDECLPLEVSGQPVVVAGVRYGICF